MDTNNVDSIWHKATTLPKDGTSIIVIGPMGVSAFIYYKAEKYFYENWLAWCYAEELVSKAILSAQEGITAILALGELKKAFDLMTAADRPEYRDFASLVQKQLDNIGEIKEPSIIEVIMMAREFNQEKQTGEDTK